MQPGRMGLAMLMLSAGCGEESFPTPPSEVLSSAGAVRGGAAIYQKSCNICHGPRGHGDGLQARSLDPAPADLRNLNGARAGPGYWFFRIKEGGKEQPLARPRSAMPAWGNHLTDEEIWQVVAYLKSLADEIT